MNILDKIVRDKRLEVDLRKSIIPTSQLEASVLFNREIVSLAQNLRQSNSGIIAEHKRRSPSKSIINHDLNVQDVASGYEKSGVCGMSVLSDGKYFGGSLEDLNLARAVTQLPLLRKEFIVDEYQVLEAKAHGADLILLIAAVLSRKEPEARVLHVDGVFDGSLVVELAVQLGHQAAVHRGVASARIRVGNARR